MEFCPKCGAMLVAGEKRSKCPRCTYSTKTIGKTKVSEKMIESEKNKGVPVMREKDIDVLPIISVACQKCGHNQAYFWTVQTRSGDEAETKFFKCVKCSYTWREYR
jgi:DNA-directed RNA polymerase subunit M